MGTGWPFEVSWSARTEDDPGKLTSPEELIAAAHASCFSMALSAELDQRGAKDISLDVTAVTTFVVADDGPRFTKSVLSVRGKAAGLGEPEFQAAVDAAKVGCPVSKALAGNVEIELASAELV